MKKLFLIFIISLVLTGGSVAGEDEEVEAKSVYDLLKTYQEAQDTDTSGLAAQFAFLASARLNLHVGDETVGVVLEDGKISDVKEGGVNDPTMELKTSRKYFNSIATSEQPLKRINYGLDQGFVTKRSHGISGKSKDKVIERALKKLDIKDEKVKKRIAKKVAKVARKEGRKFIIEGKAAGLKKTRIELGGGDDLGDRDIEIEEFTGYRDDAPEGIRKMDLDEGEENLGVYVKIEIEDIDEVVLKIDYSEEDLDYAMLDEDSLTIKWLNEETGKWVKIREGKPKWVKEVGVNKDEKYVYAVLEHASVYGVAGNIIGVSKLEEQRGYEPAYFESPEEVEKIRSGEEKSGIIDRILDFVLGLFL
ncbi:hypothetical protein KKA03_04195 [archaeon]|nr:hypothetical protein [archaeon]